MLLSDLLELFGAIFEVCAPDFSFKEDDHFGDLGLGFERIRCQGPASDVDGPRPVVTNYRNETNLDWSRCVEVDLCLALPLPSLFPCWRARFLSEHRKGRFG